MDFTLSKQQQMVQKMYKEFAENEVKPLAKKVDAEEYFPKETVEKMAKLGMMGIYFPKSVGGAGGDVLSYVMAVEELSKVCGTTGVILSAHTSLCAAPIYENGTPRAEGQVPAQAVQRRVGRRVRPDRARCRYRRSRPADLRR
jgi:butyryl-CoA dehydrogenase (EC 1.3.99.2)